ncbi:MAG: hypothetical protein Q8L16_14185, partial [Hydrogenophaga sp.]|nr:hypothetical protein [Hydrogenophaga sp.]
GRNGGGTEGSNSGQFENVVHGLGSGCRNGVNGKTPFRYLSFSSTEQNPTGKWRYSSIGANVCNLVLTLKMCLFQVRNSV